AYVQSRTDTNIWQIEGPSWKGRRRPPTKLIASSREDVSAAFAPDGKRIAFASDRSGSYEIWVCNSDGTNQVQLTSLAAADTGSPRWSPDSSSIAFDARLEGHGDIFVINAEGARRVASQPILTRIMFPVGREMAAGSISPPTVQEVGRSGR